MLHLLSIFLLGSIVLDLVKDLGIVWSILLALTIYIVYIGFIA